MCSDLTGLKVTKVSEPKSLERHHGDNKIPSLNTPWFTC